MELPIVNLQASLAQNRKSRCRLIANASGDVIGDTIYRG
jgi:hypothetical protein